MHSTNLIHRFFWFSVFWGGSVFFQWLYRNSLTMIFQGSKLKQYNNIFIVTNIKLKQHYKHKNPLIYILFYVGHRKLVMVPRTLVNLKYLRIYHHESIYITDLHILLTCTICLNFYI